MGHMLFLYMLHSENKIMHFTGKVVTLFMGIIGWDNRLDCVLSIKNERPRKNNTNVCLCVCVSAYMHNV